MIKGKLIIDYLSFDLFITVFADFVDAGIGDNLFKDSLENDYENYEK